MLVRLVCAICFFYLLAGASIGQMIRPFKDLVFSQVAAGGGYESWITVTNSGVETYTGTLNFYREKAVKWNPTVDGSQIANGRMVLTLSPGSTRTLIVSGPSTTESGFCAIVADNMVQANYLEGNLTYFVKSGDTITDGVGVMPSTEFYIATIPFEDFLTLALALVNRGAAGQSAAVQLSVYSETNEQIGTKTIPITPNEQWVTYLWQEFGRLEFGGGRLEIQSDVTIAGTALMFRHEQFSSLPLQPTMRTYTMETFVYGMKCKGQLTLWAEGAYFKGFFMVTDIPGLAAPQDEVLVHGQLSQSKLILHFFVPAGPAGNPDTVGYTTSTTSFSFDMDRVENTYMVGTPDKGDVATGTFSLLRIN